VALLAMAGDVAVVVEAADAEVMEAVAALVDRLAVHGRLVVVGRDQLDEHVPGAGHGEGDVRLGRRAAVGRALAGEVREQEPRPDAELLCPVPHARLDVLDDVGHLEDAGLRLAESQERHARTVPSCG
jgi:hypothetical protein